MTDKIITGVDGAIGRIVFNQPEKRNAVSLEMWIAVDEALDRYAADDNVRVVILSGAGGKAFVSGADISKFESERASEEAVAHYNSTTARVYTKVHAFPKPVIAQIDGFCVGGGCALAVCCDIRVCGEGAQFAVPAAKLGLGYAYAGLERLVALVGPSFAKEIFFTADRFSAEDAKFMGLVNRVVPDGEVEAFCTAMANENSERPQPRSALIGTRNRPKFCREPLAIIRINTAPTRTNNGVRQNAFMVAATLIDKL